jgi:hypothetical protein
MSDKILRQCTLSRANRKADKSVSMTFVTELEQSSEEFMEIDKSLSCNGILYFKSYGELTTQEIKELDKVDIEVNGKTKSQRLRNALFVLWKKTNPIMTKEEFYSHHMEKFINHITNQIPED